MAQNKTLGIFLIWRKKHINDRYFIILLSAFIGLCAGIAAYFLKSFVRYLKEILIGGANVEDKNFWLVVLPMIGVLLTLIFIRFILRDDVRHGIPRILFVISKRKGRMKTHKLFSSLIGGSLTAGFGGSVGLESPIISTGSSIGSALGNIMKLDYKTTILLIGCGAAGAIASIFTTPVAAVIFSLEVLMLDLTISSIIPLLMASVTGAITTKLLLAENVLFQFELTEKFTVSDVPFFILLGILTGLISLYFNRMNNFIYDKMEAIKNTYIRALIGVSVLGLLIFLVPPLYGEGYDSIKLILSGNANSLFDNSLFYDFRDSFWALILFIFAFLLLKVIATTITIESGGIGGIFAPSAVMGGLIGFLFAKIINHFEFTKHLSETNFALVGMAGVLGAVLHAPLTAIFLVAEITKGYELIVPLMLTSSISFMTIKVFDPHSIFNRRLAEKGELLTHHKDQAVLTLLSVKEVIDTDLDKISPESNLGDLTKIIAKSHRNIFPVVSDDNTFLGLVVMDDVREDMFKPEKYKTHIKKYIIQPNEIVSVRETMESVMEKFKVTGYYNLPVIDEGKYIGFISRSNLFGAYRKILLDVSLE
ncbi:chloride channel protein [Bacteroidota bacterium]